MILYGSSFWEPAATQNFGRPRVILLTSLSLSAAKEVGSQRSGKIKTVRVSGETLNAWHSSLYAV
jgi:hypothetical protein